MYRQFTSCNAPARRSVYIDAEYVTEWCSLPWIGGPMQVSERGLKNVITPMLSLFAVPIFSTSFPVILGMRFSQLAFARPTRCELGAFLVDGRPPATCDRLFNLVLFIAHGSLFTAKNKTAEDQRLGGSICGSQVAILAWSRLV